MSFFIQFSSQSPQKRKNYIFLIFHFLIDSKVISHDGHDGLAEILIWAHKNAQNGQKLAKNSIYPKTVALKIEIPWVFPYRGFFLWMP